MTDEKIELTEAGVATDPLRAAAPQAKLLSSRIEALA
jgi:hypothetical protein